MGGKPPDIFDRKEARGLKTVASFWLKYPVMTEPATSGTARKMADRLNRLRFLPWQGIADAAEAAQQRHMVRYHTARCKMTPVQDFGLRHGSDLPQLLVDL